MSVEGLIEGNAAKGSFKSGLAVRKVYVPKSSITSRSDLRAGENIESLVSVEGIPPLFESNEV